MGKRERGKERDTEVSYMQIVCNSEVGRLLFNIIKKKIVDNVDDLMECLRISQSL